MHACKQSGHFTRHAHSEHTPQFGLQDWNNGSCTRPSTTAAVVGVSGHHTVTNSLQPDSTALRLLLPHLHRGDAQNTMPETGPIAYSAIGNFRQQMGNAEESIGNAEERIGSTEESVSNTEEPLGRAEEPIGNAEESMGKQHFGGVLVVAPPNVVKAVWARELACKVKPSPSLLSFGGCSDNPDV